MPTLFVEYTIGLLNMTPYFQPFGKTLSCLNVKDKNVSVKLYFTFRTLN